VTETGDTSHAGRCRRRRCSADVFQSTSQVLKPCRVGQEQGLIVAVTQQQRPRRSRDRDHCKARLRSRMSRSSSLCPGRTSAFDASASSRTVSVPTVPCDGCRMSRRLPRCTVADAIRVVQCRLSHDRVGFLLARGLLGQAAADFVRSSSLAGLNSTAVFLLPPF